jgi:hypothetical protein
LKDSLLLLLDDRCAMVGIHDGVPDSIRHPLSFERADTMGGAGAGT